MQVAVLGPLEVRTDDLVPVPLTGAPERLLLAALTAGAPAPVSTDRLVDVLRDAGPPQAAHALLRAHVARLRACLEPGLPSNSSGRFVVRRGSGYVLTVARGDVDALRLATLVDRGRTRLAAGDAADAARLLSAGLRLWRGEPYADWPDAGFAREERRRLTALRVEAEEALHEARRASIEGRILEPAGRRAPVPAASGPGYPSPVDGGRPEPAGDAAPPRRQVEPAAPIERPPPRVLLAIAVVVTLLVAGLAVRSQRLAEDAGAAEREAAVLAEAERLAARSASGPLDVSLLLAVQGVRLAETPDTREHLAALLAEHPRAVRVVRFSGFPEDPVLSGRGATLSLRTEDDVVAWSIGPATQPRVILGIPREWGGWRSAAPFPLESAVMGVGVADSVPWIRVVSAVDGSVRLVLEGEAIGGVPVEGAVLPDGSRLLVLVAEQDAAAQLSSRWRVLEVDAATGARRDVGIGGTFPAPPRALVAHFANDAGSFVLWGEGGGDTAVRVDLDGGQTSLQVASRRSRSPALRVLPSGAAQLWTDGVITVLDRDGAPSQELTAHASQVYDLAVSPDGTWAASAGAGGVVILWRIDPTTGRWSEEERLGGHVRGVVGAEVDASGRILVTVAEDRTAISWDMSPIVAPAPPATDVEAMVRRACAVVARDLTPAEWARYLSGRSYAPTCTDLL